jgi:hypothetical protein
MAARLRLKVRSMMLAGRPSMVPIRARLPRVALLSAVLLVVLTARVRDVSSDPRATLAITQNFVRHGTLALDALGAERIREYGTVLMHRGGHTYSAFPLGTSLLATPFVLLATGVGLELSQYHNERLLQVLLVAVISVAEVMLLERLARRWLPPRWALALAGITWFGSSLASTQATALWSHDCATLLALLVLCLGLRTGQRSSTAPGWVLGVLLFLAYLCRPTMSVFAAAMLLYLFVHDRRAAFEAAFALAVGIALFVGASEHWLGEPLPPYYRPRRLAGSAYTTALFGNLLSPSRGLFVFSPLFVVPLLFFRASVTALRREKALALLAVLWPVAHLLLVSRLRHWWAGYSFGPRFFTDIVPGLFVLLCVTLSVAFDTHRRALVAAVAVLGTYSCLVHTVQGLYNRAPKAWNAEPSVDQHPELVFDWRYPQFLHTAARQRARLAEWRRSGHGTPARSAALSGQRE